MNVTCLLLVLGVSILPLATVLLLVAMCDLECPDDRMNDCPGPYDDIEKMPNWYQALCACHALAFVWTVPCISLFGAGLCCQDCREATSLYVGLIVCLFILVGFEIAATSLFAANSKYFTCDFSWVCDQFRDMFALIVVAAIISLACLAMAFIACLCRGKGGDLCGSGSESRQRKRPPPRRPKPKPKAKPTKRRRREPRRAAKRTYGTYYDSYYDDYYDDYYYY